MRVVNEGALYSDWSKLSVAFYLRARCIRGNTVYIHTYTDVILEQRQNCGKVDSEKVIFSNKLPVCVILGKVGIANTLIFLILTRLSE